MAQPQHTRNESHGSSHASDFEEYVDARAKGKVEVTLGNLLNGALTVSTKPLMPVDYAGYAVPRFSHYSKYWSTAPGPGSLSGRGLADYSSRGFFTPASIIGNTSYPSPAPAVSSYAVQTFTAANGKRTDYLTGTVYDSYTKAASSPVKMARKSTWQESVELAGGLVPFPLYVLDPAIYDERAALLLPRAVAYSAGLLDYFFNGRLRISLPDEGAYALADQATVAGFTVVRLKLTNVTPPLQDDGSSLPQNLYNGTAVAIVKYHRNTCYRADLSGEYGSPTKSPFTCRENSRPTLGSLDIDDTDETIAVSKPIALSLDAGATKALAFDFTGSPIPFGATDVYLQVAYRGAAGPDVASAEQDIVMVGTTDVSEPTYFDYFNASDYIHIGTRVYTRAQVAASQALLEQIQPRTCLTGPIGSRQLVASCLTPLTLNIDLSFGSLKNASVRAMGLPSRRYLRFAVLTDAATAVSKSKAQSGAEEPRAWSVSAVPIADPSDPRKSLLYQQTTCLPLDPMDVPPTQHQLHFDVDPPNYHFDLVSSLRGVAGYVQASCVLNGDGSAPGSASDDRTTAMSALNSGAGETVPFAIVVNPAFLSP